MLVSRIYLVSRISSLSNHGRLSDLARLSKKHSLETRPSNFASLLLSPEAVLYISLRAAPLGTCNKSPRNTGINRGVTPESRHAAIRFTERPVPAAVCIVTGCALAALPGVARLAFCIVWCSAVRGAVSGLCRAGSAVRGEQPSFIRGPINTLRYERSRARRGSRRPRRPPAAAKMSDAVPWAGDQSMRFAEASM